MAHKAPEHPDSFENVVYETGFIEKERVDQIREGHYWGVPLVMMADESDLDIQKGETLTMTVFSKKRFPIPEEEYIDFAVRTDEENENKKTFAALDENIGDIVEFQKTEGDPIAPCIFYDDQCLETISMKKNSLPHKNIWNRVEEGNEAQVKKSDKYKKIDTIAGKFEIHLDQHKDFLAQFASTYCGLIEIVSQNTEAAIFGEKEMAGMFEKITFSPLTSEDEIDFDDIYDIEFAITPVEGSKERNWTIIAVVNNKEQENIFSLEAECSITSKRVLERFARQPKKIVEDMKGKVMDIVGDTERNFKEVEATQTGY